MNVCRFGPRKYIINGTSTPHASMLPEKLRDASSGPITYPTPISAGLTVGAAKVETAPVCKTFLLPDVPKRTKLLPICPTRTIKSLSTAYSDSSPSAWISVPSPMLQNRYRAASAPRCPAL
jgi:hypothetical protein